MVMPLLSERHADRVMARLGIEIPPKLRAALGRGGAEAGWRHFAATLSGLARGGFASGATLMTFEMDPSQETLARLRPATARR
ncbi:MAG: hypothetical protein ABFS46_15870 [Myxococcota bacterium]